MKIFLAIAAVMAWLIGAMLLLAPAPFYAPLEITVTDKIAAMAQAQGAILIGLGVTTWMARQAEGRGLVAVLAGNAVVQVLSLGVAVRIASLAPKAAGSVLIHVVLGGFFLFFLFRARRAASA
jgi:hypothetical protein